MKDELILLLAFDALLYGMDEEYEPASENQLKMIRSKLIEEYGLKLISTDQKLDEIQGKIISDIRGMRDSLIKEVEEHYGK
ncbi:hypothetical protein [Rossellomorea aquimaris]|uniref:hypothetical protein n=1 Tax=Rossellomorea aquimaris TaxID=189382 RepID=UPI0011E953E0|nr:hypothetical protein [Rossellomorea aquimaris]TYS91925.1 hypothetical protein FZC88_07260 [Rossellomorea aquimaris]